MPDSSTESIVVDAAPEQIMAVIADLDAYPQWAKAVRRTQVLERGAHGEPLRVAFELDTGSFQDSYVLTYDWSPDGLSVVWTLAEGQMQSAQRGSYHLLPMGGGMTEVIYTLSVELTLPMIGQLRRKAEKLIMDTALKELKRRVESGAGAH